METLDTIPDEKTGCTITLHPDTDLDQPYEGDEAVIIAVLHRRYKNPSDTLTSVEAIEEFMAANAGTDGAYACYPLWMYDHSGTAYRASEGGNPFSCQWDSGRVGVIALRRSDFTNPSLATANDICDTYTAWANGYGVFYRITDADGDEVDSCGGFYSMADAVEAARENLPEPVPTLF